MEAKQVDITFKYTSLSRVHLSKFNTRSCQPENSDVYGGEAEVIIIFEGWLIQMLTLESERIHQMFCCMTPSLFS